MKNAAALGKAFRAGFLFWLGSRFNAMAMDKKPEKWITIKGNHIPLDKDGSPMSKTGKKILNTTNQNTTQTKMVDGLPVVGPDNIPEFRAFTLTVEGNKSFSAMARLFAKKYLKPIVESLRYPKGMPENCERIVMGSKQIGELANHLNPDKALILPFIPEIYRKGNYRCVPDEKHVDVKQVVYTTHIIEVAGSKYFVELVSKELKDKSRNGEFLQYGISKADRLSNDAKLKGVLYALCEIRLSRK